MFSSNPLDKKRIIPTEIMVHNDPEIWREYQVNDVFIDLVRRLYKDFNYEDFTGTAYLIEGIYGSGRTALLYAVEKMMTSYDSSNFHYSHAFHEMKIDNYLNQLQKKQISFIHSIQSPEGLLDSLKKASACHRTVLVCDEVTEMTRNNVQWLTSFIREAKRNNLTLIFTCFLIKRLPVLDCADVQKLLDSFDKVYQIERPQILPSKHYIQTSI